MRDLRDLVAESRHDDAGKRRAIDPIRTASRCRARVEHRLRVVADHLDRAVDAAGRMARSARGRRQRGVAQTPRAGHRRSHSVSVRGAPAGRPAPHGDRVGAGPRGADAVRGVPPTRHSYPGALGNQRDRRRRMGSRPHPAARAPRLHGAAREPARELDRPERRPDLRRQHGQQRGAQHRVLAFRRCVLFRRRAQAVHPRVQAARDRRVSDSGVPGVGGPSGGPARGTVAARRPRGGADGGPCCDSGIQPEFWPWRPEHLDHPRFVAEFWETYTRQAVHVAAIAEAEGVRMFSLGTETDRLFRTRAGGYFVNDFGPQLRSMVDRVRACTRAC